jgi:DNA-binding beta-propeller fold protein YncE
MKHFVFALVVLNVVLVALLAQDITWQTFRQPKPLSESISLPTAPRSGLAGAARTTAAPPASWHTESLELLGSERLSTAIGTKSVVFDSSQAKLYAMNLDGMSICEFDRASRRLLRKLVFEGTPGEGYNYQTKKNFDSFEEKPVEACLTHQDRYLWLSLHNAGGVVFWDLLSPVQRLGGQQTRPARLLTYQPDSTGRNQLASEQVIHLPFIATGRTPKVVVASPDQRRLYVANWHANTVSVLDISRHDPSRWAKLVDVPARPVPRGMAVSADNRRLYIGQMGGSHIDVLGLDSLKRQHRIQTGVNPRHLVLRGHYLFASLNLSGKLLQIDTETLKVVRSASTLPQPRTIALSPDGSLLFVTCYTKDRVQVFRADDLSLLGSYKTDHHPVGVAVHQSGDQVEAWVGNYASGTISVLRFRAARHAL